MVPFWKATHASTQIRPVQIQVPLDGNEPVPLAPQEQRVLPPLSWFCMMQYLLYVWVSVNPCPCQPVRGAARLFPPLESTP